MIELDTLVANAKRDAKAAGASVLGWLREARLWIIGGVVVTVIGLAVWSAYAEQRKAEALRQSAVTALQALQTRDAQVTALEAELARLRQDAHDLQLRADTLAAERLRLEVELAKTLAAAKRPYKPNTPRSLHQSRQQIRSIRW
jgi:predicted negative regulator of RcsB-dependent stress response